MNYMNLHIQLQKKALSKWGPFIRVKSNLADYYQPVDVRRLKLGVSGEQCSSSLYAA